VSRALLLLVVLTALAVAVASPLTVRGDTFQVGQTAPSFLIATLDGESVTGNFHGKPAYIDVFATWCPPCRSELPSILNMAKEYRDRIAFLLVDEQESADSVKRFASSLGGMAPVAVDRGAFAAAFDVDGLPWNIFIDRHGIVRYVYRGRIPAAVLSDQLSKLLSS
jgi:cytochrome c biogenesis protein CcmG, thiol:disulfide interchange protein DsbE